MGFPALLAAFHLALFDGDLPSWLLESFGDSGLVAPPVIRVRARMEDLARSNSGLVDVVDFGFSSEGRALYAVRIGKANGPVSRPAILITGSIHGNEYTGIVDRLPEWIVSEARKTSVISRFFDAGGLFYIVPIFNPDGSENDTRFNGSGIDLNRDFPQEQTGFGGRASLEVRGWLDFLESEIQEKGIIPRISVAYHCCGPALLYPWSYSASTPLPRADKARFERIADLLRESIFPLIPSGPPGIVLAHSPEGSDKDYFYTRYGTLAFTYEANRFFEPALFQGHHRWWRKIVEEVSYGKAGRK